MNNTKLQARLPEKTARLLGAVRTKVPPAGNAAEIVP